MDAKEFRKRAKEMVDYVADYLENIRDRPVLPSVEPGYLRQIIPSEAPNRPEKWEQVFGDIERVIMPGITQWQSPRFFAYFPANNSYVATIADILSDSIGCIGFSWAASPACTELESVMMDWLGQMLKLPDDFLFTKSTTHGGGVIQGTASEATLVALLAARVRITAQTCEEHPDWDDHYIFSRLVMYASDQSHSSVERAAMLCNVKYRPLESHPATYSLCGLTLDRAIKKDRADGLIPFFVVATLGTTPSCAFDNLIDIGPTCALENVWLHVDAAYAGTAFVCPEYRHFLNGVEFADSFNFNPHKWMLVNFDCSALWFKDSRHVVDAFNVDPLYLKHDMQGLVPDYRHWQIPLGRRFRSLKIWFVLRMYGVEGIQEHVRKHCKLAQQFAALMQTDDRFEIVAPVHMSLVCFRLRQHPNQVSEALLKQINKNAKIHLVPSMLKGNYILRLSIVSAKTELLDVEFAWQAIREATEQVLANTPLLAKSAAVENGHH